MSYDIIYAHEKSKGENIIFVKQIQFKTFPIPILSFDTQLYEFSRMVIFSLFYRKIKGDPAKLNSLLIQDHTTKKV